MHSPHQSLTAIASSDKARIPLRKPNFKLIYSNAVHGLINLGQVVLGTEIGRLWAGELGSRLAGP